MANITGLDTALTGKSDINHNHDATYAPISHSHAMANITGLDTALAGKSDTNHNHDATYSAINHNHDGTYSPVGHTHTTANITGLDTALAGKADNEDIPDISNLQAKPTTGTAAPVTTPTHIGQMNIDTTNKRTYIAEGATSGDWRRLAGTNYVDAGDNDIMTTVLGGLKLWKGTQAAYDAIGTKDANTLYFITA
jgi:hypothetical protein